MVHGDRSRIRKFLLETAVVCGVISVAYARLLTFNWIPFAICVSVAGVLALIGFVLPDGPPMNDDQRDYDESKRGSISDGRRS